MVVGQENFLFFCELVLSLPLDSHFSFGLQMKYNLPSWCDRVLWKSYPMVHVVCQSYGG